MKRTNVVVDEELLEAARRVTGERTYSATITKALKEIVRVERLRKALDAYQSEVSKGGFFWPGYLEEMRPNAYTVKGKRRVSTDEKRASRKKAGRAAR